MIQITLGKKKDVDPNSDALQRAQIGWSDGLSDQQLYEVARGVWVMPGSRVERERFAVVNGGGIIRQALEIDRVVDVPGGRRAFEGRILGPGDPVHDHYVGKPAPNGAQQNPITYFDSPLGNRECSCGCGKPIGRGDFLPGHDQRAIHERIAHIGTVKNFITWFDQTWKSDGGQQDEAV
ncbi:hypothetical protein [Actinacidiphila sp. ITFR-21]|uniref:hypothetical protein n=1 Tax=Actinacidiphila sp. ITFR-21 TaxID=3075199 RepID=UPI00288A4BD9|nr:hypothetical protein [Streptomyces sp. ITFR-21]WNI20024.1 hypothetical protein RLT57_31290 [Streptomyces sp. ITFR-21]